MFKPVVNAIGVLTAPIDAASTIIEVTGAVLSALTAIIGLGDIDYTYLEMGTAPTKEVIRVTGVYATYITVTRAQDGTIARAFAEGAPIYYTLTASAVTDLITAIVAPQVSISVDAPLTIEVLGINEFNLGMEPLTVTSENNSLLITGQYPNIDLVTNPNSNGCCG